MDKIIKYFLVYFYKKYLNYCLTKLLDYHLDRVKKNYLKKVVIRRLKNDVYKKNVSAFISYNSKPNVIFVQFPVLRQMVTDYLEGFLNDNIVDILRHEFAHLKVKGEGKRHQKWQKEIMLFKKHARTQKY